MYILIYEFQGEGYEIKESTFEKILEHCLTLGNQNCYSFQIFKNGELFKSTHEIYDLIGKRYY
jgi:hypothetical protein